MRDLVWTKVPPGTPETGPDTKGFFDICRYGTSVDHGGYTQWTNVEYMLDMEQGLFWRRTHAGADFDRWAVAQVPRLFDQKALEALLERVKKKEEKKE